MGNEIYVIVAVVIFIGGLAIVVKNTLDHMKDD